MTWLDPDRPDPLLTAGVTAVQEAARAVDTPQLPSMTTSCITANLQHGWDGDVPIAAVAYDDGRVSAALWIDLPYWDNTHVGAVEVVVDPLARRRGFGRKLFDVGIERVRAEGRKVVLSEAFDGTPAEMFLEVMGFERASVAVMRRQDLATADWPHLDRLYADAEAKSADYELVRLTGETPAHLLDDVGRLAESINDAPTDDLEVEDEAFPADRIRKMDRAQLARGRRSYRLLARHRSSGELAGHTVVAVEIEQPWLAWQLDTAVARGHRGHRLGQLLKIAMLQWMRDEEPQVRSLSTWNAESNAHMVAINELIGYTAIGRAAEFQRRL
ncbi:MAG TPA: GNAT family N-acetyltransferase [Nocardioidaceae bacterium]|nr:GNAT family N-acetyltransferase [Nocardioidaceae bacterium]